LAHPFIQDTLKYIILVMNIREGERQTRAPVRGTVRRSRTSYFRTVDLKIAILGWQCYSYIGNATFRSLKDIITRERAVRDLKHFSITRRLLQP
jgi:hypothetical protein